jgi:DNA helicase-2/ATP-dependent DNA helicase PcrA
MGNEVQEELKKQLEFSIEEEKLSEVINIINAEIINYIEKRKEITNYILDYRKKVLEDYKDDEDKIIEYFDHERYVKEESFKTIDRKLKELNILKASPYFGKVEFREEDFGVDQIYIGRFGVTPESNYEPLVVDWRAPIAALFYNGTTEGAHYDAPIGRVDVSILSKRQFVIKKAKLQGMFDSLVDIKDEILQLVLSKNSSDKLKDIIMTIQKEQDDIIRQPRVDTVVVDGVAGSGKTTIALHRVAYLLYNYRKILEDKVLILGPNNIFMEYISTVLPSLGEGGVIQTTFKDFALDLIEEEPMEILSLGEVMENILQGNQSFIDEISYKTSAEYKEFLDEYIKTLNISYFKYNNIDFRGRIVLTAENIVEMFQNDFISLPLFRRSKKIKRIVFSKLKDLRDEEFRRIQKEFEDEKASWPKDELIFHLNDIEFRRKLKIRELIHDLIEVKKTLNYFNPPNVIDLYHELNKSTVLTEYDLGAILYLKVKLEGLRLKNEIKHIVIDEAQDYSPIQFIALKEITRATSMTIVGDSNQRMFPTKEKYIPMNRFKEVIEDFNIKKFSLEKSYRSTKEIMEYSNRYLSDSSIVPLVRSGDKVLEINLHGKVQLGEEVTRLINEMRNKDLDNIAIITRDVEDAKTVHELLKGTINVRLIDRENIKYNDSVIIIPSYYAKGLEFDGVIIIDTNKSSQEDKLKYIMCTRALHNLCILNIGSLD